MWKARQETAGESTGKIHRFLHSLSPMDVPASTYGKHYREANCSVCQFERLWVRWRWASSKNSSEMPNCFRYWENWGKKYPETPTVTELGIVLLLFALLPGLYLFQTSIQIAVLSMSMSIVSLGLASYMGLDNHVNGEVVIIHAHQILLIAQYNPISEFIVHAIMFSAL